MIRRLRASTRFDKDDPEPPRRQPEPKGPVGEARRALTALPAVPPVRDLLRRVELDDTLLSQARSLVIQRLPEDDVQLRLMATGPESFVLGRKVLRQAAERGGPGPVIQERMGPGTYELRWIGAAGQALHRDTLVIPDLRVLARQTEKELEQRARERRNAAAVRRRQDREERERAEHQAAVESWVRGWVAVVMDELVFRRSWLHAMLTWIEPKKAEPCLLDAVRRGCCTDPAQVRASVSAFLHEHAAELWTAPPWIVTGALGAHLPVVPDERFVPWSRVAFAG
ncbi:MAG: hypothetical protein AB7N76_02970 [Planctomycetota bacterium]